MKGHYQKVPDSTKAKKFPNPRVEPNQYKEPIGPHKPSIGERIISHVGDFNRAIAPHIEPARRTTGRVQRYSAKRSRAMDSNFGGGFNPMTAGAGWMNMSFPGSGFGPAPAAPKRRRRRKPKDNGGGWGLPLY